MAKTSRARAWFFPTSPRSPYKLQGELKLLKLLEGKPWNHATQIEFAELLKSYAGFEGHISTRDPAFSARDRVTRAPRLLGLVHLPKKGQHGLLRFTAAGNQFLELDDSMQTLFLQRQIAKIQFASPLHRTRGFEAMSIKPLGLMIEMLLALNRMSKDEIALFGLTTINAEDIPAQIAAVKAYRKRAKALKPRERKQFRHDTRREIVLQLYEADLRDGNTKLREGGKNFVLTKLRTLHDYADASVRYLRATGLFTVTPHGQFLELSKTRIEDARFLLDRYGSSSSKKSDADYDEYIQDYLGNPELPHIRHDLPSLQDTSFDSLISSLETFNSLEAARYRANFLGARTPTEKLKLLLALENELTRNRVAEEARSLRQELNVSAVEIENSYEMISSRHSEIIDRPLTYEWNTWRAMVLINDARSVIGNYSVDADGNPVSTAAGNRPDLVIEYETFHLAVEVTLSSGQKQYEMEGESVTRHVGQLQKRTSESNDSRPVYGIMIAETINETVTSHLLNVSRYPNKVYAGPVRIVPLDRREFCHLMQATLKHRHFDHRLLKTFFESIFLKSAIELDEIAWRKLIHQKIEALGEPLT